MAVVGGAMAEEPLARIDINGKIENIEINGKIENCAMVSMNLGSLDMGVIGEQCAWLNENKDKRLSFKFPVSSEWKKYSFSFTPKNDGKVILEVMGNNAANDKDKVWFWFDNFTIVGAEIKNGDFETTNANGRPAEWVVNDKVIVGGNAQSGSVAVKVNHDYRVFQMMEVKAGISVTVTCWIKADIVK